MNNRSKKNLLTALFSILFLALVSLAGICFDFYTFLNKPAGSTIEQRQVRIPQGSDLATISNILYNKGIITSAFKFKYYVLFMGLEGKLKAGEYHFTTYMSPRDVLERLLQGELTYKKITIPEGLTLKQVARLLSDRGLGTYDEIIQLLKNKQFIEKLGIEAPTLEGYLFPDTYFYSPRENYKDLIEAMVAQFKKHFDKIWKNKSPDNPLSRYEVLILASMVEKEAMVDEERPIIAGVFLNRLQKGMLLQCDPTVIYGLKNFNGNLTRKDLESKTPYNTYVIKGLPPGPICNPGLSSLKAAANPAKVKYLFFVSMNNGHHFFSQTIREHINAVRKYQMRKH